MKRATQKLTTGTVAPQFLTKQELLQVFPVSLSTIDRMLKAGTIPCMRFGRRAVFNPAEVATALGQPVRVAKR